LSDGSFVMSSQLENRIDSPDFRVKTAMGVGLTSLIFLTPFSVNNFVQGRLFLGAGSAFIVAILAFNAWSASRDKYYPTLTFLALVPIIIFFLVVALRKQDIIGALWCYPALISFYFILPERKAWLANAALLLITLPQIWVVLEHSVAMRVTITLLVVSTFSIIFLRMISIQQHKLETQIATDPLTGLNNRTLLQFTLERAIQQSQRTSIPMTLIILDLDHFKTVNDTLGHDAGDSVLRGIGKLLMKRLRGADKVFRLGGEEFALLLYDTDEENGIHVAEELRTAIESSSFIPNRSVTASIGVASLQPDEDWKDWMKRGDQQMYRAKSEGRNQVAA